jgi:hypothetical protein
MASSVAASTTAVVSAAAPPSGRARAHASFGALPAPALACIVAFVQNASATDARADLTALALTERAALAAVLDVTLLRLEPGPALLACPYKGGERGGRSSLFFDFRDTAALHARVRDFLGSCLALESWLAPRAAPSVARGPSARAARGLPCAPVLPPGVPRAAVAAVAVVAAAAADFPARVTRFLTHADAHNFIYKFRTTDFDDDLEWGGEEPNAEDAAAADEHGECWRTYMDECPTPHCSWVRDTHLRAVWAPARQRRAVRALRALLRAAGGVTRLLRAADEAASAARPAAAAEAARAEAWRDEVCFAAGRMTVELFAPYLGGTHRKVDGSRILVRLTGCLTTTARVCGGT